MAKSIKGDLLALLFDIICSEKKNISFQQIRKQWCVLITLPQNLIAGDDDKSLLVLHRVHNRSEEDDVSFQVSAYFVGGII